MLILPIKKKWFEMILSGEKKEEYREIKSYYRKRFENIWGKNLAKGNVPKEIMFRNGYRKDSPSFIASCTIDTGFGRPEWGAEEGKMYFRLHVGKIKDILL